MAKAKRKPVSKGKTSKGGSAKPKNNVVKKALKAKPVSNARAKAKVAVGKPIPIIELDSTAGRQFSSAGMAGKIVVLYFYPKDATPGCTIEGHDFSRLKDKFSDKNAEIFGISRDSMASHQRFKEKECYTVELLSDGDEKVCRLFGVIKEKNMYGRKVMGIERSTFVIDRDGNLVKEWRGVKVAGHAEEVLEFVQTL
jgi:peroxiredoxin Q/BCP